MYSEIEDSDGQKIRTVAISARNCVNWGIFDFACCISGFTSVTLYDTLGKESTGYIMNQCEIKTVFCESKQVKELVELRKDK
jgi:long-chain acyl-CoA synthetase